LDVTDTTGTLTILGAGAETTVIDANQLDRVIDVRPNANLELNQLTLTGGNTEADGGALQSIDANVNILDTNFEHNTAGSGGAISVSGTSTLNLFNVVVSHNSANLNGGGITINAGATANILDTEVTHNQAQNTASKGGGIESSGILHIANSNIQSNEAVNGGGIYATNEARMISTVLSNNRAIESGGGGFLTGYKTQDGLWLTSDFIINSSTIYDNWAANSGGGLVVHGTTEITNSTISQNTARTGGAISTKIGTQIEINSNTIYENSAWENGGGIICSELCNSELFSISQTVLAKNTSYHGANNIAGEITSLGNNFVSDILHQDWLEKLAETDIVGIEYLDTPTDPIEAKLERLTAHPPVYVPQYGSPLIDAGNVNQTNVVLDSRDLSRFSSPLTPFKQTNYQIVDLFKENDTSVNAFDWNSDQYIDFYSHGPNGLHWYENDGNLSFAEHEISSRTDLTNSKVFDLDADNKNDFIVSNSQAVFLYRPNAESIFEETTIVADGENIVSFTLGDFNDDGLPDIAIVENLTGSNGDMGQLSVYLQGSNLSFTKTVFPQTDSPKYNYHKMISDDLDLDGDLDLITISYTSGTVAWHENDGEGGFESKIITSLAGSYDITVADIDNDGHKDLLTSHVNHNNNYDIRKPVRILINSGNQEFTVNSLVELNASESRRTYSIDVADLNYDGRLDIITLARGSIYWYENQGNEIFAEHELQLPASNQDWTEINPMALDIDNDSVLELISSHSNRSGDIVLFDSNSLPDIGATELEYRSWAQSTGGRIEISARGSINTLNIGLNRLPNTVSGLAYLDLDRSASKSPDEPILANISLYLDTNENKQHDTDEPMQKSNASGYYKFDDLPADVQFNLRVATPPGFNFTNTYTRYERDKLDIVQSSRPISTIAFSSPNLLLGSPQNSENGFQSGSAYIVDTSKEQQLLDLIGQPAEAGDKFGYSIDINGNTAVIGAPWSDVAENNGGAAYVFEYQNDSWQQVQILLPPASATGFGKSVAIDGGVIIVGSPDSQQVRIFESNSNNQWISTDTFSYSGPSGDGTSGYGWAVDIAGDYAIIGAPFITSEGMSNRYSNGGIAFVLKRVDGVWGEFTNLGQEETAFSNYDETAVTPDEFFGWDVAVTADGHFFASTPGRSDVAEKAGAVWYFNFDMADGYIKIREIIRAIDASSGDEFGKSLSVFGDTLIVGAPKSDHNGTNSGAAYIFRQYNGAWRETDKLLPADGETGDQFGSDVAIAGRTAFIATNSSNGTVYSVTGEELDYHPTYLEADDNVKYLNFGFMFEPSSITGNIYRDLDVDGIHDASEVGFEGWTVYIDADLDGVVSSSDPKTTTDSSGKYSFTDLEPYKTYTINQLKPTGYVQTDPVAPAGFYSTLVRPYVNSDDFQALYDLTGTAEGDFYFIGRDHDGRGYNSAELFHYSAETTLVQTLTNTNQPQAVTTDGSSAFWIDSDRNGNPVILKRAAGDSITTVVYPRTSEDEQLTNPVDIEFLQMTHDKTELFIMDGEQGQLWLLKAGELDNDLMKVGAARYGAGSTRHHPSSIVVDENTVYMADSGLEGFDDTPAMIASLPLEDDRWTTLYSGDKADHAKGITVGRDKVYFSSAHNIYELDKNGGEPTGTFRSFTPHIISDDTQGVVAIDVLDLDADGWVDILSASYVGNSVEWHQNNASQTFETRVISEEIDNASHIHGVDIDQDGDVDVITVSFDDNGKILIHEFENGNVTSTTEVSSAPAAAYDIKSADFDNDGDIDLVCVFPKTATIAWFENDGDQNFTRHIVSDSSLWVTSAVPVDMNQDGHIYFRPRKTTIPLPGTKTTAPEISRKTSYPIRF
jgi:predicted outer membrane repeat protein